VKLLVDTHLVLWAATQPEKLSKRARSLLGDSQSELLFSAASIWEVVIKAALGRNDFEVDARLLRRGLLDNEWHELPITSQHAIAVDHLPPLHRDPFDRILLAQAEVEGLILLTSDPIVAQYPGSVQRV
jgi:PIN domain nuclease of toxin-antitoxin system